MTQASGFDQAIELILSFEGEGGSEALDDEVIIACSNCFYDTGLQIDAWRVGRSDATTCSNCSRTDGAKLSASRLNYVAKQYFVRGSIVRSSFGAAPRVQFNSKQKTSIQAPSWLQADIRTFERLLGVGFFDYGPRLWMLGEITPLKILQDASTRDAVIERILREYPRRSIRPEDTFFRVRRAPANPGVASEYDSPPASIAGSGRLESKELSVLYGSPDIQVCLHECRVSADDELFMATLNPVRELVLLDLSAVLDETQGTTEFESLDLAVHMLFLAGGHAYEITRAIAKAVKEGGYDGVVYPSYFSLLRTGAVPFETAYGLSLRRVDSQKRREQAKTVPNLALFGWPIHEGKVQVRCIDRVFLAQVSYDPAFGPVDMR